jgi:hypothetical protein
MKYIITENRLDGIVDKYITSKFNDLKFVNESNKFVERNVWVKSNGESSIITIKRKYDETIVSVFVEDIFFNSISNMFSIGYEEIQEHLIRWFENHMNIKVDEIEIFDNVDVA